MVESEIIIIANASCANASDKINEKRVKPII